MTDKIQYIQKYISVELDIIINKIQRKEQIEELIKKGKKYSRTISYIEASNILAQRINNNE